MGPQPFLLQLWVWVLLFRLRTDEEDPNGRAGLLLAVASEWSSNILKQIFDYERSPPHTLE